VGTLLRPGETLEFGVSRAAARLMLGVVAGHDMTTVFDGDETLRARPMRRVLEPLALMGAEVLSSDQGRLPLTLRGTGDPAPIEYAMPLPSPQLKSAVLLAGLNSPGRVTVVEPEPSPDHIERMLSYFGAELSTTPREGGGRAIALTGRPRLAPRHLATPGDPALAAFAIVAAATAPGAEIIVENVLIDPWRAGFVDALRRMGAEIELM
jgi:3-phosphoshikimate 1-carboxyvinyltransferase